MTSRDTRIDERRIENRYAPGDRQGARIPGDMHLAFGIAQAQCAELGGMKFEACSQAMTKRLAPCGLVIRTAAPSSDASS